MLSKIFNKKRKNNLSDPILHECPVGLLDKPMSHFVVFQCDHKVCYEPCFKKMVKFGDNNLLKCPLCCRSIQISTKTESSIYKKSKNLLESRLRRKLKPIISSNIDYGCYNTMSPYWAFNLEVD